ncbi:hypothetical protein CEUSTIGMA_g4398.t1 [Chlamydomonas eustigma]|uniref:TATA-box binding protein n=1 Tax=Chlamydomonas eustigma TaxID=1157962 RepID=A0A250X1K0_9CHLO|nr:hypothetical protein CEUSTIGMA_g4398.t1 [Chlamydomonas eustigma]|eukprot:GAX76951.1 hypothetical protein CEUSTIGMA_g4398.t1 [Chlamydomonas eustigma]
MEGNAIVASDQIDRSVHPSGIVPTLQNVVATVNLGCRLDLKEIALHARNAEYNPKRFAAVIMRIRDPKTTALIFASGKMVCTGAKSEDDSKTAARKYAKIVTKLGFAAKFKEFKIQNIVGSCDVRFPIRLEGLAFAQSMFASYEPEIFPGLIYRMKSPKVVLLIFVSGKVVLTGGKLRKEIYEAFENIYPILQEFRKGDANIPLGLALPSTPSLALAAGAAGTSTAQLMPPPPRRNTTAAPDNQRQDNQSEDSVPLLPPPSPARQLPPPSPMLPPPSPAFGLPPPSPYNDLASNRGIPQMF